LVSLYSTVYTFASKLLSCYVPDRISPKEFTTGEVSHCKIDLGAHYCRQQCEKGGVPLFVHNSLGFTIINIAEHCKNQDIEICALKLSFGTQNICILTLYRALSGNFSTFLLQLDTVLQSLYPPRLHFIMCGDININYIMRVETKANWTTYYCPIT